MPGLADYLVVSAGTSRDRLRSLDGLRGVAALIVVCSHVVLAGFGSVSEAFSLNVGAPGAANLLLRTPLAIVWAGPEVVVVFFVLSGFVLTRALLHDARDWRRFYRSRAGRLYLPVWASLIPAALLMALVAPTYPTTGTQFWMSGVTPAVSGAGVLRDALLVLPHDRGGTLNAVLWSLRWEVLFSLALPVLMLAAAPLRRLALPVALLALAGARWGSSTTYYLAPFVLGLLLALHEPGLLRLRDRLAGRRSGAFVVLAAVLLTGDLWLPHASLANGAGGTLVIAGAVVAVTAPLLYGSVARYLEHPAVQWLGSRSFSLYLVHLPIVLACASGLRAPALPVIAAIGIPSSLLAAELFHRVVERPSLRLAHAGLRRWRSGAVVVPAPNPA